MLGAVEVRVACFEVCGKQCYDLLKSGEKLIVREDASGAVQASALGQHACLLTCFCRTAISSARSTGQLPFETRSAHHDGHAVCGCANRLLSW